MDVALAMTIASQCVETSNERIPVLLIHSSFLASLAFSTESIGVLFTSSYEAAERMPPCVLQSLPINDIMIIILAAVSSRPIWPQASPWFNLELLLKATVQVARGYTVHSRSK